MTVRHQLSRKFIGYTYFLPDYHHFCVVSASRGCLQSSWILKFIANNFNTIKAPCDKHSPGKCDVFLPPSRNVCITSFRFWRVRLLMKLHVSRRRAQWECSPGLRKLKHWVALYLSWLFVTCSSRQLINIKKMCRSSHGTRNFNISLVLNMIVIGML